MTDITTFPRFLLEPSPRFMLQLSHFLPCLNQLLVSLVRTSFTSNNSKSLGGFGTADGSRKRSTRNHVGSWGSRARQVSKEYILEGRRDEAKTASGGRILATIPQGGRRGRRHSRAGALRENGTAADRDVRATVGILPRRRR